MPIVTEISRKRRDPFDVLVSTILSLRTKDQVTREASRGFWQLQVPLPNWSPAGRRNLQADLSRRVLPTKARTLRQLGRDLLDSTAERSRTTSTNC